MALIASSANAAESLQAEQAQRKPLIIAHRGASGYLPEHTLASKALAYAMKPGYIEQDLVLSKDNQLIVMHDIYLDSTTNVASAFPRRAREDGHYYTIDFTLAELKQLQVSEAFTRESGQVSAKFPGRFPLGHASFQLATLDEEIELIQGLNKTLGYNIGIYPEIKNPQFHHRHGRDLAKLTLEKLKQYGYSKRTSNIYLQSFDAEELQRIKRELMPQLNMDLPLVQLIAMTEWGEKQVEINGQLENYRYDWMLEVGGMEKIATYADAIGPWAMMLAQPDGDRIKITDLVQRAHKYQLKVHPYTLRADPQLIPPPLGSFDKLLSLFIDQLGVDGVFTDHPDKVSDFLSLAPNGRPTSTAAEPAL
jgi:glycerophosphoryl diester phosphodiesterase